jgi:hypothetical protein
MARGFGWNPAAGRYVSSTGAFIPFSAVKDVAIEALVVKTEAEMLVYLDLLRKGTIDVAQWESLMMRMLKNMHSASAIAARGGIAQMSQSDWGYVGSLLKEQYKYLHNFAQQIASGKQPLNGFANRRVSMYAEAVRSTFEQMRRRTAHLFGGATEERRMLGPAEHCTTVGEEEGCTELAKLGWQPIGSLPKISKTPCKTNCKCKFVFRKPNPKGGWTIVG